MTGERVVWVARHGERLDFADASWAGRAERPYDPPLSVEGRRQAGALARRLSDEPLAHLFSSPFLRCVESAAAIGCGRDLPVKIEAGLSEWLNRDWFNGIPELLSIEALAARYRCIDGGYRALGLARYGESGEEALRRSAKVARQLVVRYSGNLLLVGHGASVLGALTGLLGCSDTDVIPDTPYGGLSRLVRKDKDGAWQADFVADVSHLPAADPGPGT
jgi:broad specificity phosphatase PhoE